MANSVGDAGRPSESLRSQNKGWRLTLCQGYAIAEAEVTISRDEFQKKMCDPQTGHAE